MTSHNDDREAREWERAVDLRRSLQPFVATGFQSRSALRDFCDQYRVSRSAAYRYLAKLRTCDRTSSLKRLKPGRKPLSTQLSDKHERAVEAFVGREFLSRNKISMAAALEMLNAELEGAGLHTVSLSVLKNRIATIQDRKLATRREGSSYSKHKFRIIKDRNRVDEPLAVVQIDHTLADIFVVDPQTREALGRPYLTVSIDVATRMVTGLYLSMSAPSAMNLMAAFRQSVFPKSEYLRALNLDFDWPAHGLPVSISSDNGSDLKSEAFRKGLDEHGVLHHFRPVATPHLGGHVERLIGSIQRFFHTLPGTTFSSVEHKGTYKPERRATLTLRELERLLINCWLSIYLKRRHKGLGDSPLNAWNTAWQSVGALPRLPRDPHQFRLDFLPFETRRIQREGVELFGMFYRSKHLQKMLNCGVRQVIAKYDPNDIREIQISADDIHFYSAAAEHRSADALPLNAWKDLAASRRHRLNEALVKPDHAAAHSFKKGVISEAKRLKRSMQPVQSPIPSSVQDARSLGSKWPRDLGGGKE